MSKPRSFAAEEVERIHAVATEQYCDDDIELDDLEKYVANEPLTSRFSEADNGVWIQAWLWVPDAEDGT